MDKLLIIDGSNLLFQMFYGMPSRIVNKDGKAIQGTLGFIGATINIMKMTAPDVYKRQEVNHPVTRLFHKIVYHNKKYISIKNVVFPAAYFCSATIYFLRFFPTKIQSCYHILNRCSSDFHILNTFKFRKVTKNLMDCGLISVELVFVNPSIGREQL